MIWFDNNKQAYAYEIPNYIATVNDNIWTEYAGTDKWDIINGVFTDITDTEEYKEKKRREQQEQFQKDFFNTSLGYVRRQVHMKDGSIKDFLSDILPLLQIDVPIITYNIDGTQNVNVLVTSQFIEECKQQLLIDFYGVQLNNQEENENV